MPTLSTMSTGTPYAPSTKPLPLPREYFLWDVPDGPWQEITVDYLTHQGKEYLLICDFFSKYPFLYKVTTKSAQSLCMCQLELISQHGPPSLLSMDSGQPFLSEELTQFLFVIAYSTSHPPPISPGPTAS